MAIPNFLKTDKLKLLMNIKGELVFYIPESYFERGFAVLEGDMFTLMGLFQYSLFSETGSKLINLKMFRFPSTFACIPSSVEIVKKLKLNDSMPADDYRLLKFIKDDVVIVSTKVSKGVENIEMYLKMLNSGKVPTMVPYKELHELFIENAYINGTTYPASNQLVGIIIGEMARSNSDISTPYRQSKKTGQNDYIMVNINELPKYSSPIASITGENWNDSMVTAITNDKYKRSPLETLFQS